MKLRGTSIDSPKDAQGSPLGLLHTNHPPRGHGMGMPPAVLLVNCKEMKKWILTV